jgi:hypothetical protein
MMFKAAAILSAATLALASPQIYGPPPPPDTTKATAAATPTNLASTGQVLVRCALIPHFRTQLSGLKFRSKSVRTVASTFLPRTSVRVPALW